MSIIPLTLDGGHSVYQADFISELAQGLQWVPVNQQCSPALPGWHRLSILQREAHLTIDVTNDQRSGEFGRNGGQDVR